MSEFKSQLITALLINVSLKVLTFSASTYVTRQLLPEQSGISFTCTVYVDVVLFIAREAVRNVACRYNLRAAAAVEGSGAFSGETVRRVLQLSAVSAPIALVGMLVLESQYFLGIRLMPSLLRAAVPAWRAVDGLEERSVGDAWLLMLPEITVWVSVLATACAEPCLVLAQCLDLIRTVVLAEFYALAARLSVMLVVVHTCGMHSNWEARMAAAFGQLIYAIALIVYYALLCSGGAVAVSPLIGGDDSLQAARAAALQAAPQRNSDGSGCDTSAESPSRTLLKNRVTLFPWCVLSARAMLRECRKNWTLWRSFFSESVLRIVMLDGETFALTSLGSEAARGYYQLISNLGSMVARLVFRVWENACFVKWSRDVAAGCAAEAVALLVIMLRVAIYVGFTFPLLGPPLAPLLLRTLYSSRWATAEVVAALQWYCGYVPCLAVAGLLDAFLRAGASAARLSRVQRWMVAQSLTYVAVCYLLLRAYAQDSYVVSRLIIASIVNTLGRIVCTLYLLYSDTEGVGSKMIKEAHLTSILSPSVAVAMALLFVVSRLGSPSVAKLMLVAVSYAGVVLRGDAEVRGLLTRGALSVIKGRRRQATKGD